MIYRDSMRAHGVGGITLSIAEFVLVMFLLGEWFQSSKVTNEQKNGMLFVFDRSFLRSDLPANSFDPAQNPVSVLHPKFQSKRPSPTSTKSTPVQLLTWAIVVITSWGYHRTNFSF